MSDWTCGRCGARVLSGLSHACQCSTGGNIAFSEQVTWWTNEKLRADKAEAENQRLREELDVLRETHDETQSARMQLQGERARLRAERDSAVAEVAKVTTRLERVVSGIEKLRDEWEHKAYECENVAPAEYSGGAGYWREGARRLTDLLEHGDET